MKRSAFALAALLFASPALAQDVVPPKPLTETHAQYPAGATGAAEVTLDLVIGLDGRVDEVVVIGGDEPFARAASDAAKQTTFDPATRGGKSIKAKIRIAVTFTPPEPPRKILAPEPTAEPVQEVQVFGRREPKSPTEHRLGRAEMRVVPGAFGDPFRAIDILPGLVPIVSGLPYFYIRGAPPSAVGYYIDEVKVPYLFHFALGPGVIQPALVEEVALHPAAYPGRYGRYAGGIVAGTTRDPATELYGEGQIRIYDAGAYVEVPFADGRATAGVGGRYSYTAAVISLAAPDLKIDYRDYNARASYQISDHWRASAFAFGSYDYASSTDDGREKVFFASEFHRLDLRLDRRDADGSETRLATTFGIDRTRLEDARFAQNFLFGVRGHHRAPVTKELDVEIGFDALVEHDTGDLPSPYAVSRQNYDQAVALFSPHTDTSTGAWLSGTWHPSKHFELTGTLRGDFYTSEGKVAFGPSPRASMRIPLHPKIAFLGALGIAPQTPAFSIPIPAVGYHGLPGGLAYAYQKSAGFEFGLPARFTMKTVGFHHSYFNLRDFAQDRGDISFDEPQLNPGSPSQAFGLEVFLSRKLSERFAAFTSVTITRSQLGSTATTIGRVSPFDRPYVVQLGGVVDFGKNWKMSARFLTYGGWPTDPPDAVAPSGDRLPAFYRFDARIEKRWIWKEHRYVAFVIEGQNVTASRDIISRSCQPGLGCQDDKFGPVVVPSIGVEGGL